MKTVIEMAREAGMRLDKHNGGFVESSELKRFAELVRADEREAIIDLVAMYGGIVDLEAAIRARNETSLRSNT